MKHPQNERKIDYPAELTFKSVFRKGNHIINSLYEVLDSCNIKGTIAQKESSGGKFISFTLTAVFPSDEMLKNICDKIASIDGFMTMF